MKDVVVKKSAINKNGVFAARNFSEGEVVLKWNPRVLKKSEMSKLSRSEKHYIYKSKENDYYLMQKPERFVNHSCEPNTKALNSTDVAIKKIKKG